MTQAPHLLPKSREGFKYGDVTAASTTWPTTACGTCSPTRPMGGLDRGGNAGSASRREEQDAFSARSHQRAAAAWKNGLFDDEVVAGRDPAAQGRPDRRSARTRASAPTRRPSRWPGCGRPSQGRHDHRRLGVADLRRRCRGRRDEPGEGRGARPDLAGRDRRARRRRRPGLDPAVAAGGRDHAAPAPRRASSLADLDLVEINEAFAAVGIKSTKRARPRPGPGQRQRRRHRARATRSACPAPASRCTWRSSSAGAAAGSVRPRSAAAAARATRWCCTCRCLSRRPAVAAAPTSARWSSTAREGDARAVARLISLVEDASPRLREVMAALAPHSGPATVIGLTGAPGVGKSTTTTRAGHGASARAASGSACSPSTRRRRSPAGRCSATGCGCRSTRSTRRLHPVDGQPRAPRRPGLGDAAGAAGARRRRLRRRARRDRRCRPVRGRGRRRWPTPPSCCWRPAWATASRRRRPASSRSATSTWSTRPTATAPTRTVRELRHMLALGERRVAGRLAAADRQDRRLARRGPRRAASRRSTSTGPGSRRPGRCAERRLRRAADEVEAIALTALREKVGDLRTRRRRGKLGRPGGRRRRRPHRPLRRRRPPGRGPHRRLSGAPVPQGCQPAGGSSPTSPSTASRIRSA